MVVILILLCVLTVVCLIKFSLLRLSKFQPAFNGTSDRNGIDKVNRQAPDFNGFSPESKYHDSSNLHRSSASSNTHDHLLKQNQYAKVDNTCRHNQINQYVLKESIGQGSYGIVQLAHNTVDNVDYAMKILSKKKLLQKGGFFGRLAPQRNKFGKSSGTVSHPLERVHREIAVLQKVDHPNVVKLVDVLDDSTQDNLYLVFELLEQGPVTDVPHGNRMEEGQARKYFRDLLLGIEYLHRNHIIHRDIKPANLLLGRDGRLRIADFGVCTEFCGSEDVLLNNTAGTPAFIAPEQLVGPFFGKAADIWAMGVTLYVFIYGILPFRDSNALALHQLIQHQELSFPSEKDGTSDSLKDLLARLLCKDPSKRITVPEILEHPWVAEDCCSLFQEEDCVTESSERTNLEEALPEILSVPHFASLSRLVYGCLVAALVCSWYAAKQKRPTLYCNQFVHSILGQNDIHSRGECFPFR